jgi:hypothetical protein
METPQTKNTREIERTYRRDEANADAQSNQSNLINPKGSSEPVQSIKSPTPATAATLDAWRVKRGLTSHALPSKRYVWW